MATPAALGKASAGPAISAALFQQDYFYARKSQFSWSPRFYFYDEHGNTLAFVRNATFAWKKEIRVFTDPTLSFELLAIKPVGSSRPVEAFQVTDSVNQSRVGAIRQMQAGPLQRRRWVLMDSAGEEIGTVGEDSALLGGIRRLITELAPQSYTFLLGDRELGWATQNGGLFTPELKIDLSSDSEKRLDRRLVAAAVVLMLAFSAQPLGAE